MPTGVDQAGLAGQGLSLACQAEHVAGGAVDAGTGQHQHLAVVTEQVGDGLAQPARGGAAVKLGLDHDVPAHHMQTARKPEHGGQFGSAGLGLLDTHGRQF